VVEESIPIPLAVQPVLLTKVGEDEFRGLMRGRFGRNSDENDNKGYQGGVEGDMCECRQWFGIAIEDESKQIRGFVGNEDMPRLDHTVPVSCLSYPSL